MNFVKYRSLFGYRAKKHIIAGLFSTILFLPIYLCGCSDQVTLTSTEKLAEFENAGPLLPNADIDHPGKAQMGVGPYRVVPGDVLELTMPAILQAVTDEVSVTPDQVISYPCRVGDSGTINLSVVGEIEVAGKTLSQIESAVIDAYYPAYTVTQPSVYIRVMEYEGMEQPLFAVMGLVNRPGNFPYPRDVQYNLMQALAFAGGFNLAADPRYASVYRLKPDGTIASAIFKLVDVKKSSQFTDALNVLIKPGDIVAVEHTPRTRTKLFLDSVFRINIGTYFNILDAWE